MNGFCLDLISCNCKVMKYLLFGSANLCRFKVSGALSVSPGGTNGSRVARAKASNDKSEACESVEFKSSRGKPNIYCLRQSAKIVYSFSVSSCYALFLILDTSGKRESKTLK